MASAPCPVSTLTACFADAATRGPQQLATSETPLVYAMFSQPAFKPAQGRSLDYCTVLWLGSKTGWLVYFNGVFAYRVFPHENADVPGFLRDLRTNRLEAGNMAVARYRARA